jgi:hypothetical protein
MSCALVRVEEKGRSEGSAGGEGRERGGIKWEWDARSQVHQ